MSDKKRKTYKRHDEKTPEETGVYLYIGPSIRGSLKRGEVIHATWSEIVERYAGVFTRIPAAKNLVVRDVLLPAAMIGLKDKNNLYGAAFRAVKKATREE